jgi:hypothetical protein
MPDQDLSPEAAAVKVVQDEFDQAVCRLLTHEIEPALLYSAELDTSNGEGE